MKYLGLLTIVVLLGACNRDIEEFRFDGVVVGAELCSSSQTGYVIEMIDPDDLGGNINIGGTEYNHAVMAYRSPSRLYKNDTIHGVAYKTKSFAALNCMGLINNDLPEIILLSVDED